MTTNEVPVDGDPSDERLRLKRLAAAWPRSRRWWLAAALTLLVAFWTIVPWRPTAVVSDPPYLDPSWVVVLHLAFLDGLAFGEDIVFTYGPWGFVATRTYVPGTFGWLLFWWIALAAAIWYAAFAVALTTIRNALPAGLWLSALLLLMSVGQETAYIAVVVLFVTVAAGPGESRHLTSATVVLAALLAWLGLVKFTYFGLGIAVVLLVTAWSLAARHRVGPALPAYVVAWLVVWLAAAQPIRAIPDYVVNGLSVATGYTSAMSIWSDTALAIAPLIAGAVTLGLVVVLERGARRRFPVLAVGYGVTFYVAFKAGFVREDNLHTPIALLAVAVVALVVLPLFGASDVRLERSTRLTAVAISVATAAAMWVVAEVPGPVQHAADIVRSADDTLVFFAQPGRAAASRRSGWSSSLDEIRAKVPLPRVTGTVDLYPDDQVVLVANRLRRFSRPVFQSYSAYTPRLIALNEAHLRRADRPRTIFVDLAPIDGRWPTSEDGPNLVRILADYRLRGRASTYLVFEHERRSGYRLERVTTVRARLRDRIAVPAIARGPIWVTIDVRRTLLGRLEELALRPAALFLDASLADGRKIHHRLVPGVAERGFLLSPYLADRHALAAMAGPRWRSLLAPSRVRSIAVRAHADRFHGYANDVEVTFSRVLTPR